MTKYKRNQVEEAIFRTFRARGARIDELRFRLKRLLAADRGLGWQPNASARDDRQYAFFSQEPPGKGTEITFSGYEALALAVAIMLLEHGLTQGRVVRGMRQARRALEAAHARTLEKDPRELFDQKAILAQAKPGLIAVNTTDPIYLVFVRLAESSGGDRRGASAPVAVCHSQEEVISFMYKHAELGPGITVFELSSTIPVLATHLAQARAKYRGRGAG